MRQKMLAKKFWTELWNDEIKKADVFLMCLSFKSKQRTKFDLFIIKGHVDNIFGQKNITKI